MSAVYPLHLEREISRRWLHRHMFVDRSTVLDRAKHPNDIRPLPKRSPDRTDPLLKSGLSESDRNKRKSSRALPPEQFFADFCLSKPDEIAEYWRSGGVTGEPLFYPRTYADLPYCMLGFDRTFQCVGFEKGDICHMSLPLGVHPAGQMWARSAENLTFLTLREVREVTVRRCIRQTRGRRMKNWR